MPVREPKDNLSGGLQPDVQQLNASGDTSSCVFQDWFVHTQNINGMWTRKWVFDPNPTFAGDGSFSGCPAISFTYVDVNFDVECTDKVQRASYCSGAYSAMEMDYLSDSAASGGFGLSGNFWTTTLGIKRREALATDPTNYNRSTNANVTTSRIPGQYQIGTVLDTSSAFNSNFMKVLYAAQQSCPTFDVTLVNM